MTRHYDEEESFHARDRKQFRKERKEAQRQDRSKFKKTDLVDQKKGASLHMPRGRVIAISGEGAWIDFEGKQQLCSLKGIMKKETKLVKNLIAVGDWVRFQEDRIEEIEERSSVLARTDISGRKEQLIAVNVDQVIIAVSVVHPPLKPALVDRYLIAAEKGGLHPIIAITKIDLLEVGSEQSVYQEFLSVYESFGIPILSLSIRTQVGIEALRSLLQHKTSVIAGQSGVGKSSLLNACFGMTREVGELAIKTSKGSHTTTKAELIPLPGGGYCVDTPGIRSFGVWSLTRDDITAHFQDIAEYGKHCKYPDCAHFNEPQCKVQEALQSGKLAYLRYQSYVNLLAEVASGCNVKTWS